MSLDRGRRLERTHANTGRTCKLHRDPGLMVGLDSGPSRSEDSALTASVNSGPSMQWHEPLSETLSLEVLHGLRASLEKQLNDIRTNILKTFT